MASLGLEWPYREEDMGEFMAETSYRTKGVCSRAIRVETDGDTVVAVEFDGGCDGNLKGISKLVEGRSIDEVIEALDGTRCGTKDTSCPDQLAQALKTISAEG